MIDVLRSALDGMSTFVYTSDLETGTLLFVNKRMRETFGIDGDVSGIACREAMQRVGGGIRCASCPVSALKERPDSPVVWEERDVLTGHWYKSTDSVIDWFDGKKAHLGAFIDITALRQAEMDLRQSHQALKNILNSLDACVFVSDLDTDEILFANRKTTEMFLPDGDMTGRKCWETMQKGMAGRCPFCRKEQLRAVPGAAVMWEEHNALVGGHCYKNIDSVIDWINGKKAHMQYSIDITRYDALSKELLTAKEAAERANQTKSQFLSKVSHEIRTPMNAIIGMTEILLGEEQGARQRSCLSDIKISATALLGIINDILDFSKMEAGKLQLVPVDFDILKMLENIQSMFSFSAGAKGIFFSMDILEKLPQYLYGDDIRLRQILINVIGNAVKFTREGGVTVVVGVNGDMLTLEIADTGVGIKPEHLPDLFSDFTRLDMRNNRAMTGTGLGLSITKSLISLMNGTISVKSEYGKGTVFRIRLPLIPGDGEKCRSTRAPDFVEAPEAAILVVDDNELNLNVARGMLSFFSIVCDTASDGVEAIQKIAERKYDIVFMDHMMPEMDGVETTRILREQYGRQDLIVIALTANAQIGAKEMFLAAQMNDYLSKPIDKQELNRVLNAWLPLEKKLCGSGARPSPATDPEQDMAEPLALLRRMEDVNVEHGLSHHCGMPGVYVQSLRIMARRLPEIMVRLVSFLEQDDLKQFSIEIHGLKGAFTNLGIPRLARMAEALEFSACEGKAELCRERLPRLRADAGKLHFDLIVALSVQGDETSAPTKSAPGTLQAQLPAIRTLLDAFEVNAAVKGLRELVAQDFGVDANAALRNALFAAEEFDYDRALAALERL